MVGDQLGQCEYVGSGREGEVAKQSDGVARNFGVLAGLASSVPSAAVFLHGWPHEALGDELCHCLIPEWLRECNELNI
jgi:hypothetical protein